MKTSFLTLIGIAFYLSTLAVARPFGPGQGEGLTLFGPATAGSGGISSVNGLTDSVQTFATGTSGTDFAISSSGGIHTFNLPTASAANRGLLSTSDWSTFNAKQAAGNYITALTGDVTASGPGSVAASISAATVTGKALTGFSSGAGTVADTDTILQAFNKIVGNLALKAPLASPSFTGTIGTPLTSSRGVVTDASGNLSVASGNLSGTNSGDVTIGTANGLSLAGQALSLQAATDSLPGAMTAADHTAFTGLKVEQIDGMIESPSNKTYILRLNAKYAGTINEVSLKTASGTITAKLQKDGVDVTSCTGISVSSSESTTTCTGANSIAAGETVTLVTSSNSSAADLQFSVKITR